MFRRTRRRNSASVFDISHRGKVELRGPDAVPFLHNLSSNDVRALKPGSGCEAFLATAKAKLVAHLYVHRVAAPERESTLALDVAPAVAETVLKHLGHYLISEQVELIDRTRDFAQVNLAGPEAPRLLGGLLAGGLPDLAEHQHVERTVAEVGCQIRRYDRLGVPGFDIICPTDLAERVWHALTKAGAGPAGRDAYECLRIEAGTGEQGIDFSEENLVMELGRTGRAISYSKGCFPGQEPIVRSRDLGHVNWAFRGLRVAGIDPVPAGAKVTTGGKEVGRVTSARVSPRLKSAVALAFLRRGSEQPGTGVEIATESARRAAEVTALPFPG